MLESTTVEYFPNYKLPLQYGIKENVLLESFSIAVYAPIRLDASGVSCTSTCLIYKYILP